MTIVGNDLTDMKSRTEKRLRYTGVFRFCLLRATWIAG